MNAKKKLKEVIEFKEFVTERAKQLTVAKGENIHPHSKRAVDFFCDEIEFENEYVLFYFEDMYDYINRWAERLSIKELEMDLEEWDKHITMITEKRLKQLREVLKDEEKELEHNREHLKQLQEELKNKGAYERS